MAGSIVERIAALERAGFGTEVPVVTFEEMDDWRQVSTDELRRLLQSLGEKKFSSPKEQERFRASFVFSAMRWALSRQTKVMGLEGTPALVLDRMERVIGRAEQEGSLLPLSDERSVCDCLVFFGRLVPLGIYHADVGGIPRSLFAHLRLGDSLRLARYVGLEMRAFGPTLAIHLPKQPDRPLSEKDYVDAHRLAEPLFEANPQLRGFYNSAWYYDPNVAIVSPRLAFLSQFALSHGAIALCLGPDADSIEDATWKSETRRRLYSEGRYLPQRYARVWSRRRFLDWARSPTP